MIDEAQLAELMLRAIEDNREEPTFLKALLDAKVYAHTLQYIRGERLRLIQFTLPTRQLALPFFSERAQAIAAAGRTARIVAMTGRQLFELTRGATLVLNPNSTPWTLYPEEIAALLDDGQVAIIERVHLAESSMHVSVPELTPVWMLEPLTALYARLACVEAAYLAEICLPSALDRIGFLIVLEVETQDAERAARATTTILQPHCDREARSVDLTTFEPGKPPAWLAELGIKPFYHCGLGKRWPPSSRTMQ